MTRPPTTRVEAAPEWHDQAVRVFGTRVIQLIEIFVLGVITLATIVAIVQEIWVMVTARHVTLADILLLFILLEVLAMVSVVLRSGRLPVQLPLFIAIVALARYLIIDVKAMDLWQIIGMTAGVVLLAIAILLLRYGDHRFPEAEGHESGDRISAKPDNDADDEVTKSPRAPR